MNFKKIHPLFCGVAIVLVIICSFKLKVTQTINNLPANCAETAETKTFFIELVHINPLDYEKGR
ncbi:MAG: hypothetical protein EAZ55_13315 [Cytophagales bacterium]|jgi:hypothetical protein|nr:MAG: hypothetical protein EAZ55_13315 [Cytophagales bacterium]